MAISLRGKTKPAALNSAEGVLGAAEEAVIITAAQNTNGVVIHHARWVGSSDLELVLNLGSTAIPAGSVDYEGALSDTFVSANKAVSFEAGAGTGSAAYSITYEWK